MSWSLVGIAVLSLLMCGGCSAEAQSGAAGARQGQAEQQALPPGEAADLWNTVRELRAEVTQLRQEVARLRAQVADTGTGGAGTGGSGSAGMEQGTGGSGTAGTGVGDVPPAGSGVPAPQGTAVVTAVHTGEVSAVSGQRVVIRREDGTPLALRVDSQTQVFRDGERIGVRQLEKGEQVRAVVDLLGDEKTVEIAVRQPAAAPEE